LLTATATLATQSVTTVATSYTIYFTGSGTVTLMVSSAGDADYNPSSSSQLLTISNDVGVVPEDLFKVLISKAVSLNGDGLGDKFVIKRIENYPENEVVIVDKGGKLCSKHMGITMKRLFSMVNQMTELQ
jgi:hypothetical protein